MVARAGPSPERPPTVIHTIGYEGSSIDEVLATLGAAGVDLLIDVRELPLSRKRGFSKSTLRDRLGSSGIDYVHLRGLGDPKPGRLAARAGRWDDFRRIFDRHMAGNAARTDLDRAMTALPGRCVCLLCFERDHSRCHRSIVAQAMVRQGHIVVQHLVTQPKAVRDSSRTERDLYNGTAGRQW